MKLTALKLIALALFPVACLTFSSCSSAPPKPAVQSTSTAAIEKGVPGGVFVETHELTATVTAVDAATRNVTLLTADGKKTPVKCGPDVVNFDQIHVGDKLKVMVAEELAVYMAKGHIPPSDGAAAMVALAPKGAKPGGIMASTVQIVAKVTAIDLKGHKATLQFPDGTTKTVAVRKDVDLSQRSVGEEVVIRMTEALALSVQKP